MVSASTQNKYGKRFRTGTLVIYGYFLVNLTVDSFFVPFSSIGGRDVPGRGSSSSCGVGVAVAAAPRPAAGILAAEDGLGRVHLGETKVDKVPKKIKLL